MKKVTLIRSLRDLAAFKAKDLCTEDKPYYKQFLDVYEKKLIDDLVKEAIDSTNRSLVQPVIQQYAEKNTDIPLPFEVDGKPGQPDQDHGGIVPQALRGLLQWRTLALYG